MVVRPIHTQMEHIVREAAQEDTAKLARLRWEFRVEDQPGHSRSEFVHDCQAWLREALGSRRWLVVVAESETGPLCGCVYLQCIDQVPVPGEIQRAWGYITNSYVAFDQRGLGLGRKLIDRLIDVARGRGLEFLIVWPSEEAVSFYQRAGREMSALGEMLAALHGVPVKQVKGFLTREEVLYSKHSKQHFTWMTETIAPYLKVSKHLKLLSKCYEIVVNSEVEEVVIHGDFGPHQVIVDSQGRWVLVDFEYAAISAFADDLAGAEVRLEQVRYPVIAAFLTGYGSRRPVMAEYELVRGAYKGYNLLAMLTYGMAHRGQEPLAREVERLGWLLAEL